MFLAHWQPDRLAFIVVSQMLIYTQTMSIFVIIPTARGAEIESSVSTLGFPLFKLPKGELLVSYKGTSRQLCDDVGIGSVNGHAVVFSIDGYWGNAPTEVWEWVKNHWGQ